MIFQEGRKQWRDKSMNFGKEVEKREIYESTTGDYRDQLSKIRFF